MTCPMLVALPLESMFLLLFWQPECLHPLWSMGTSWKLEVPPGYAPGFPILPSHVDVESLSAPFGLLLSSDGFSFLELPPLGRSLHSL